MTVTTQRTTDPTTSPATTGAEHVVDTPTVVATRSRRGLVALVGGLAVVTAATVGTWLWVSRPAPDTTWTTGYAVGSATYDEQVPEAPWTNAYGPGTAVQQEQVPSAPAPWTDAYGPGSTVAHEQVPRTSAPCTPPTGPGSTTWVEQVPAQGWSWSGQDIGRCTPEG